MLRYRRFPAQVSAGEPSPETAAWARSRSLGFLEDTSPSAVRGRAATWAAEGRVLHGLYESTEDRGGGAAEPVATVATLDARLDLGRGCELPTVLVADVTVRLGHEGQGLMRSLMEQVSAHAIAEGAAVMALHAAHPAIYERLGYAPATRSARVDVDVARFALRRRVDGRVREVDRSGAAEVEPQVRAIAPERLGRLDGLLGAGTGATDVRHLVHDAPDGSPDALMAFRFRGWTPEAQVIEVLEDLGSLEGRAALWQTVASTRIAATLHRADAALDDPLPWLLRDRSAWRVTGVADGISLRVLDPSRVLTERRYWCPATRLVVEVSDPTGAHGGRWAVRVDRGAARVATTEEAADVTLDAVTLSAALLGGSTVGSPFHTSRVSGTDDAVSSFRTLMSTPWDALCTARF
jgi:hypothetical protein